MGFFRFWQKSEKLLPAPKGVGTIEPIVREHHLTLSKVEVYTLLDHFRVGRSTYDSYTNSVSVQLIKPNSIEISYNPTGKTKDHQVVVLPFDEFVEKMKGAFFS